MCKVNSQIAVKIPDNIELYYNDPTETKRRTHVSIDSCLIDEIKELWSKGIRTLGCCCGHGELEPYINVHPKDFDKTIDLGYEMFVYPNNINRKDAIKPKTNKIRI